MSFRDDDLTVFAAEGPPALPEGRRGVIERAGARIWYADMGAGVPVLLLHGGLGNAGNWGHQAPALLAAGYRVIAIDTRGHGRSSWGGETFSYDVMADDALAVMDAAGIARAAVIGWSDGAVTGLAMARKAPERVAGVFYFACNVDATGAWPFEMTDVIGRCLVRHKADYADLSATPERFDTFAAALGEMQGSQPNYAAADLATIGVPVTVAVADLATIGVPVTVAVAEHDEFIRPEHGRYIAATIPGARLVALDGVSHFAPVQRPDQFNAAMLDFLGRLEGGGQTN